MSSIDFSQAIISKKGVITQDREVCGNIIGERDDSILVEKGVMHDHIYVIPKSRIEGYDGSQIILNVSLSELKSFEEKRGATADYVTDGETTGQVKETAGQVKDTITDTISGTVDKVKGLVTGDDNKE
jgi:hypothetical protein